MSLAGFKGEGFTIKPILNQQIQCLLYHIRLDLIDNNNIYEQIVIRPLTQ